MAGLRSGQRQALFAVADQGLSSASNFLLGVFVARSVGVDGYGAFAVAFSVYGIAVGMSRAVGTDALLVRFSDCPPDLQRAASTHALGAAAVAGIACGLPLAAVGMVLGGDVGTTCVAFGIGLPVLFAQEGYRYLFIMIGRAHVAAANDLVWILGFLVALATPWLSDSDSPGAFVSGWCGAAALAVVVAAVQSGIRPALPRARAWVGAHADLSGRYAAEYVVSTAGSHVVIWLTGVVAGLAAGGALRGAYVLMAPVWIAATGVAAATVPAGVRLGNRSLPLLAARVRRTAVALASLAVGWTALVLAAPDRLGEALLGESWLPSRRLMLPLGVVAAGFAASSGFLSGLRSLGAARRSLAATLPTGLLLILAGAVGAVEGDARTVVLAMIAPSWLAAAAAARHFHSAMGESATPDPGDPPQHAAPA